MESDLPRSSHVEGVSSKLAENLETKLSFPRSKQPVRLPEIQSKINWSLVLFGKMFSANFVKEEKIEEHLNRQWNLTQPVKISSVHRGVFQWEVKNEEDKLRILNDGPWLVGGHIFSVKPWEKNTPIEKIDFRQIDFWIQIYQLPMERLDELHGSILGSSIGVVVKTDPDVYAGEFGTFIRVKVSLNTQFPLPDSVDFLDEFGGTKSLKIRIERLNIFCFHCGKLGHEKKMCGNRNYISNSVIIPGKRYNGCLRGKSPLKESKVQILNKEVSGSAWDRNVDSEISAVQTNSNDPPHSECLNDIQNNLEQHEKLYKASTVADNEPGSIFGTTSVSNSTLKGGEHEKVKGLHIHEDVNTGGQLQSDKSSLENTISASQTTLKKPIIRKKDNQVGGKKSDMQSYGNNFGSSLKRSRNFEEEGGVQCVVKMRKEFSPSLNHEDEEECVNPWRHFSTTDKKEGEHTTKLVPNLETDSTLEGVNANEHVLERGRPDAPILDTKEGKDVTLNQPRNLKL